MKGPHKTTPVSSKVPGAAALLVLPLLLMMFVSWPVRSSVAPQSSPYTEARWMRKLLARQVSSASPGAASDITVGANVDVSNERGPQSEVFIAVATQNPNVLAAGSNEIFRNPQRTYFSIDGGASWIGADQPLVDEEGTTWTFASDPGVAIDTHG